MQFGKFNYLTVIYIISLVLGTACGVDTDEVRPPDPDLEILARPPPTPEYCTESLACNSQEECGITQCYICTNVCVNWHADGTCCDYQSQCGQYACNAGVCNSHQCQCY